MNKSPVRVPPFDRLWVQRRRTRRCDRARRGIKFLSLASAVVTCMVWLAPSASADVTITPSTAAAGATAILEVSFSHGCDGSATNQLTIQIPKGVTTAVPTLESGWKVEKRLERLNPPVVDGHGAQITERVAAVTYRTDEPAADGFRQVFELSVSLPETEGATLAFPVIQTCEEGETAWTEVAQDGASSEDLVSPAPMVTLTGAQDGGDRESRAAGAVPESASASTDGDNDEAATAPTVGSGAGGSKALVLVALLVGLLGVALGGAALVIQRRGT